MNTKNLPSRLSEKTFRHYETYIADAVALVPDDKQLRIAPTKLAQTTFCARLRDAIRSLKLYRWTTFINMEIFDIIVDEIEVVHRDTEVIVRRKTNRRTKTPDSFTVRTTDYSVICALFTCLEHHVLPPVKLIAPPEELLTRVAARFPTVIVIPHEGYTLLT